MFSFIVLLLYTLGSGIREFVNRGKPRMNIHLEEAMEQQIYHSFLTQYK